MSFWFVLDTLRYLTYGSAPSFKASELSLPLSTGASLRQAYSALLIQRVVALGDMNSEDATLLLTIVLADILGIQLGLGIM